MWGCMCGGVPIICHIWSDGFKSGWMQVHPAAPLCTYGDGVPTDMPPQSPVVAPVRKRPAAVAAKPKPPVPVLNVETTSVSVPAAIPDVETTSTPPVPAAVPNAEATWPEKPYQFGSVQC